MKFNERRNRAGEPFLAASRCKVSPSNDPMSLRKSYRRVLRTRVVRGPRLTDAVSGSHHQPSRQHQIDDF